MRTTTTSTPDSGTQLDYTTAFLTLLGIFMITVLAWMRS